MYTELYFVNNPLLIQVFEKISESDCENAKVILRRIQKREFYKSIAEIHPQKGKMTGQAFKSRGVVKLNHDSVWISIHILAFR